jgi:hypothetical protein
MKTLMKAPGTAHHYYRPSRFLPRVQLWLGMAVLTVFLFNTAIAYHAVYGAPECLATKASAGNSAVVACAAVALAARVQS